MRNVEWLWAGSSIILWRTSWLFKGERLRTQRENCLILHSDVLEILPSIENAIKMIMQTSFRIQMELVAIFLPRDHLLDSTKENGGASSTRWAFKILSSPKLAPVRVRKKMVCATFERVHFHIQQLHCEEANPKTFGSRTVLNRQ